MGGGDDETGPQIDARTRGATDFDDPNRRNPGGTGPFFGSPREGSQNSKDDKEYDSVKSHVRSELAQTRRCIVLLRAQQGKSV